MKTLVGFVILAFMAFVILAVLKGRSQGSGGATAHTYKGKKPLTDPEQTLFHRLKEAAPQCIVLAQVALPAIVQVGRTQNFRAAFNRIAGKYVDFVICLPDFTVVAVVELDDRSHSRPDRVRSDTTKNVALGLAGHPILRYKVNQMPTVEELQTALGTGIV